jgi:hypothetical protein
MSRFAFLAAASAVALSGCGGGDGAANNSLPESGNRNGQLTARVQGVDLKIDLPPPIRRMTEDGDFLYPGARAGGESEGERFHSDDPPETVAGWYRAPARAGRFTIANVERQGPAFVLTGTARGGARLRIRLFPGAQGGTDGTLVVTPAG